MNCGQKELHRNAAKSAKNKLKLGDRLPDTFMSRKPTSGKASAKPSHPPTPLHARSKKPLGLPTRGKTAANRLRPTDTYLALCHAEFVRTLPGLFVDLGYGETPQTTLESAARLRRFNAGIAASGGGDRSGTGGGRPIRVRTGAGVPPGRVQSPAARGRTGGGHPRDERPAPVSGRRIPSVDRNPCAIPVRGRIAPGRHKRSAGPVDGLQSYTAGPGKKSSTTGWFFPSACATLFPRAICRPCFQRISSITPSRAARWTGSSAIGKPAGGARSAAPRKIRATASGSPRRIWPRISDTRSTGARSFWRADSSA